MKTKIPILHYGNINHLPIVFIHGFPFDNYMWNKQVEELSREYYCITYDIRGLGDTSWDDYQFTIEDLADDLLHVLDTSGIERPVICGLSMGGYITLRALERDEKKFRGVILCDTKADPDNDQGKIKRAEAVKKVNEKGAEEFVSEFIASLFSTTAVERLGDNYLTLLNRALKTDPKGIKGCLLAMAARTDTSGYLGKTGVPVMLLCGENDKLTPPDMMRNMANEISNSEFHIIKDAGHMAPFEKPEEVNYLISSFLKKHFPVL